MSNSIELAYLQPERFVNGLSRYMQSKVVYYTVENKKNITFTTYKKQTSSIPQPKDVYTVISPGMEYRPDLLSKKVYGETDFWWKIMEANNIKDIFDFKCGLNIRLPGSIY